MSETTNDQAPADGPGPDPANDTASDPSTPERCERRVRFVPAEPQQIFDLLADPSKHHLIDGSGTVRTPTDSSPARLSLGAKFGMKMKFGVPYTITNEVVEFDEPHLIGWRHMGGHIWRYRLRPVDGGTEVTEEFDWAPSRAPWLISLTGTATRNAASIEATLERLGAHFADG